jgi:serine/threonine-protein kinase
MSHAFPPLPVDTAETARDVQDRVGRFAGLVFALAAVMGTASVATHFVTELDATEVGGLVHQVFHLVLVLPPLLVWLLCRGRPLRPGTVGALDAGITIAACLVYALLGSSATTSLSVAFSVVLGLTYTLVGRSIIVPSSFTRTLWISAAGAAPVVAYLCSQAIPVGLGQTLESSRVFSAFSSLWCLFAVVTAAASSRQLYGLRARIREIGKLGQYTLEDKIGEGGMGVVFRARHALLRRPAAIKLLSKERSSERDQARFEREVQLTSRLTHPNTVSIFDYGRSADGTFYYVMEYLDGLDLNRLVEAEGPIEPARVIHLLTQVCGALGEAHALHLVHRDIKPANIVLTERADEPDVVKVVDFGLAKTLQQSDGDTLAGAVIGTPLFLAPEAINRPDGVDGRADLYGVGAVGYYLLTGRHVFEGQTVVELLGKHLLEPASPPSARGQTPIPADLDALVLACLAKDPGARPQTAHALRTLLFACEDAPHYDRAKASAWWRERGERLRAGASAVPARSPATMAIDFAGRATARD